MSKYISKYAPHQMVKIPNLEQYVAIFPKGTCTGPDPKRVRKIPACINFLRYRAASDPNQRHSGRTEEIRRLVMTCCKLYLLDIR